MVILVEKSTNRFLNLKVFGVLMTLAILGLAGTLPCAVSVGTSQLQVEGTALHLLLANQVVSGLVVSVVFISLGLWLGP